MAGRFEEYDRPNTRSRWFLVHRMINVQKVPKKGTYRFLCIEMSALNRGQRPRSVEVMLALEGVIVLVVDSRAAITKQHSVVCGGYLLE